jgi:hypothetical protein
VLTTKNKETNLNNNNSNNNNPLALQPIEGQHLPTMCWPNLHLFTDRGERLSTQIRGDMW